MQNKKKNEKPTIAKGDEMCVCFIANLRDKESNQVI